MEKQSSDLPNPDLNAKGISYTPLTVLVFLALLTIFTMLLSSGIYLLLETIYGVSFQEAIHQLSVENSPELRNYIRLGLATSQIFIFMIPPLVVAIFFFRKKWVEALQLRLHPYRKILRNGLLGIVLILAAFPLAQFTFWLNKQIPLPQWAISIEDSTNAMLRNLLGSESSFELLLNILVIAVIPAIGEELLFRGIIQKMLEKWTAKPHLAIIIAAFIFSAFHMQFEGFLPRFLLGAMLGYLLYWSGSLWVPIVAHFAHNAMQVIAMYLYSNQLSSIDIDQIEQVPVSITIVSTIFVFGICYYIIMFNKQLKET